MYCAKVCSNKDMTHGGGRDKISTTYCLGSGIKHMYNDNIRVHGGACTLATR